MKTTLRSHFSHPRHHVTNPQYKRQAMQFIRDQFREYGLETHVDVFPTRLPTVNGVNVIGILKGTNFNTPNDVIVGVAAHYDTMRNTPGVDDNGAAVVAMLQAAKQVASRPHRKSTVMFVAFDFEEWEQVTQVSNVACANLSCGSEHFVHTWVPNFWSSTPKVAGVMVMDTIMNFDEIKQSQKFPAPVQIMSKVGTFNFNIDISYESLRIANS
ncbi:uncharacterized protein LOC121369736 [Gigantopelta aegis]|uniref:uncharacterized protein LOC121369736 n=1 Tax=Gigantopelta aegis TaxID=1735272 RepID=UPI001B88C2F1|nr:uncharacterized protein LOC121369736 [Gigantopelta aegis]